MSNAYPLWKVVFEQMPIHDSKTASYSIYAKLNENVDWYKLYETVSEPWSKIALNRLQDIFDVYISKWLTSEKYLPTMFELHDQMYKTTYVLPSQSCICGETIAGNNHYGELSVSPEKFDYVKSNIFFYEKGECVVKGNQLFLDGELLLNCKELDEVCKSVNQNKMYLDSSPDKLVKYITEHYPEAQSYACNGYCSFNIRNI